MPAHTTAALTLHTELSYTAHYWRIAATATLAHSQDDDAILSDIHVGSDQSDTLYALRYRTAGSATDADGASSSSSLSLSSTCFRLIRTVLMLLEL